MTGVLFKSGILLIVILGAACTAPQKTVAVESPTGCNLVQAGAATIRLTSVDGKKLQFIRTGQTIPTAYSAYTLTGGSDFFQAAKTQPAQASLRLPSGCQQFTLTRSETMSPELARKYPQLVSLKGGGTGGRDLRIDWDGQVMRGQVIEMNKTYLIEPYNTASGTVYLVFDKADVPTVRRPFESENTGNKP
ncbi:MAG: hypothetical protein EOP52_08555 [Sphingobacteriales bacterium]|nr:MAG: hypothetical protein EOP52_08555 [Sphingobacteriales bacterium]